MAKTKKRLIEENAELLAALQVLLPVAAMAFGAKTVDLDRARAAIARATGAEPC